MKKYLIIVFLSIISVICLYSSNLSYADSLLSLIDREKSDTNKIRLYNDLAWYYKKADVAKAIEYTNKAYNLSVKIEYKEGIGRSLSNFGAIYYFTGKYDLSLKNWLEALKLFEEINNSKWIAKMSGNIGLIYEIQKQYEKAIEYQLKSLEANKKINNYTGIAYCYNNLGVIYNYLGDTDKELSYYLKSLDISREHASESKIAGCLNNIGTVYQEKKELGTALKYHNEALDIYQNINNKSGIAEAMINIGIVNIGLKNYKAAEEALLLSLKLARELDFKELVKSNYQMLSALYETMGSYKNAVEYFNNYHYLQDTLLNEENQQYILELQTVYETEKKEIEIETQQIAIKRENELNKKKKQFAYFLFIALFLASITLMVLIANYIKKRKTNRTLTNYNILINQQKAEIEAQRDLAAQQRDIIAEQKKDITDSIHYASKIQEAIIPDDSIISEKLSGNFIFYQPRDIVSGDFYWINEVDNKLVIIAADCTGHGVPGAFMSMLGTAFLDEIVTKEKNCKPSVILEKLRQKIINTLNQEKEENHLLDGMEVAVLTFDFENHTLEYSGANSPLYVVSTQKQDYTGNCMEIKPTKQAVIFNNKLIPFENHIIELHKDDIFYIFSDGFVNQFGGKEKKRFKYSSFKKLLFSISNEPMEMQREILIKAYEEWKGELEQVDDILIIGLKI